MSVDVSRRPSICLQGGYSMTLKVRAPVLVGGLLLFAVACGVGFGEFGQSSSEQQPLSDAFEPESAPWTKLAEGADCTRFEGNSVSFR